MNFKKLLLIICLAANNLGAQSTNDDLANLRGSALDDLFVLRDYRAGKVSFVESPERHSGVWTNRGYRYTLLDFKGMGSIRHIWTTRGIGEPYFDWEFYVDGETNPSVRVKDIDMIRGARSYPIPVAPTNYIPLQNRAFNFYLPVPFEKSLRLDVVQQQETFWLWFCQIDYRLRDASMRGTRLISHGESNTLAFSYLGLPEQRRQTPASSLPRWLNTLQPATVKSGQTVMIARFDGPAMVRELRLKWSEGSNLRLLMRYDEAVTFAVNSPLDRFFGPFKGVSFFQHATNESSCYLPMPFQKTMELFIQNEGSKEARIEGVIQAEKIPGFAPSWGYFHARHQPTPKTDGHRPHQVLYVRGRGHWVGMTLYKTGHDHGGGDFAVIDGEGPEPAFLHGVNGEDYFTFAWFGQGAHHPYAMAQSNDAGRYRHHLENVYPFHQSLAIEWGAFAGLSPESVAVWYQDSPADTTLPDGDRQDSVEWDVFGPVPIPPGEAGKPLADPFSVLPAVTNLDAGKKYQCLLVKEKFTTSWMKEWSVGPMLNLTYVARHSTEVGSEAELGGMGHAYLARRFMEADRDKMVTCLVAHDDPLEIWVNDKRIYQGQQFFNGFESTTISLPLHQGKNEILVRLTNYFNRDFNWAGFLFRPNY